jgi:hypothetical protein
VGCGFCIFIYWIYIRRCLQSLITFPITSHKPVTSSGVSYSWGASVTNSCGELLLQTAMTDSYSRLLRRNCCRTPMTNCSCRLLLRTDRDELLFQTPTTRLPWQSTPPAFIISAIKLLVCLLPRYMHFYRPLLSCNNTPLFRLPMLPCLQNSWEQVTPIVRA